MKTLNFISLFLLSLALVSCVSKKKFLNAEGEYRKTLTEQQACADELKKSQDQNAFLTKENRQLQSQADYLKKNNNQVIGALQDMSVLSGKQAESIKKSLETISGKDAYIQNLQSAIARKDSLNMLLVMNLKSSLSDVNDKDINIKVEKGVVYVDISDKLLFNTGQYAVTDNAKKVLGKVARVLNAYPDLDLMVEGHTDNVPIHTACLEDNWDLSVKRATSVVRILEKQYAINPKRMTAAGHGLYEPLEPNTTKEGKALNRRTRIVILPQLDQFFKLITKKS